MAVVHYEMDGKIVCGTKVKSFKSTDDKNEVTCKRCKSKISKSVGLHSGQIKSYMKSNEREFFIDSFKKIKDNGTLTGINVYNHFKE